MALSSAHTSSKANDIAELLLLNRYPPKRSTAVPHVTLP